MSEKRESISFQSGGSKLFGMLHLPQGVPKAPCVLFCHSLAGNKIGKDRIYVEIASKLSQEGIASLRVDMRGSGDSEGFFHDMLPEYYNEDICNALEVLEKHESLDPSRIGILGRSFGGTIAVESAERWKKIKSLVLWCPMFSGSQWNNLLELLQSKKLDENEANDLMRINGQQGSTAFFEHFMKIDVENALSQLEKIPLLHIHGDADTKVSVEHAENYERVRKKATALSKFIRLLKSDHDFSDYDEKQQAINETVNWFKETL